MPAMKPFHIPTRVITETVTCDHCASEYRALVEQFGARRVMDTRNIARVHVAGPNLYLCHRHASARGVNLGLSRGCTLLVPATLNLDD